jgi:hypothetical protein
MSEVSKASLICTERRYAPPTSAPRSNPRTIPPTSNITATTTEHSLILTFDVEEGLAIQFDLQTNPLNGLKNWCTNIKIVE